MSAFPQNIVASLDDFGGCWLSRPLGLSSATCLPFLTFGTFGIWCHWVECVKHVVGSHYRRCVVHCSQHWEQSNVVPSLEFTLRQTADCWNHLQLHLIIPPRLFLLLRLKF
eukprot:Blabericola_migrator_1__11016@NODE_639_length_7121_cov_24_942586_g470_i0_p11_GENE_NODE_639_length_7121_cov_24_942586_g470_i0NODE_639_length_7121_cov_24_942586_g470_i0_p11_ORF_typecomplete_len111_score7_69GASA/PF02704_14/0_088_NODE_639_length_7121_cov_24_942586_g470_i054815813